MLGPRSAEISSTSATRGALISSTVEALKHWELGLSKDENLRRLEADTRISAITSSYRRELVRTISRRLDPGERDLPLTLLIKGDCAPDILEPILLFHITRDEYLMRDFFSEFLFNIYKEGRLFVDADDMVHYLTSATIQSKLRKPWKPITVRRIANGLLQAAVEFGLLEGKRRRQFQSYHLGDESFLYLLHAIFDEEGNAAAVVVSSTWQMFLMDPSDVERELLRLHQFHRLHYEAAGSIAQLKLPQASPADYARELVA